jgi:SNF family Na+-dependent transporter
MPLGNLFGMLWFFMLFLAAITSSISMYQPTMAFIEEALGVPRKTALGITATLGVIGSGWCVYYSGGMTALGTIDDWVGTFLIVVLAAVQVIAFGWIFGIERGKAEAHEGAAMRIPGFVWFIIKYIAPLYLLITIARFCWLTLPGWIDGLSANVVARNSLILVGLVIAVLAAMTAIGTKRWRAMGLDVDGERGPEDAQKG